MKLPASTALDREIKLSQLRKSHEVASEYARAAAESLNDAGSRGSGLLALRAIAEAYGGLGAVAAKAGISRESLYRSLSPKGNPTLKTLIAILNTLNLRLSVVEAPKKKKRARSSRKLAA